MLVRNGVRVLNAAVAHGACALVECPAWRGEGSPVAIIGREKHVCMLSFEPLEAFASATGAHPVLFDQCRTGLEAQKATLLLCTPNVLSLARKFFGDLRCDHSHHRTHLHNTSGLEQYTEDMCWRLAQVLAMGQNGIALSNASPTDEMEQEERLPQQSAGDSLGAEGVRSAGGATGR